MSSTTRIVTVTFCPTVESVGSSMTNFVGVTGTTLTVTLSVASAIPVAPSGDVALSDAVMVGVPAVSS